MLLMPWRSWVGPDRLRYSQRRLASALRVVLGLYWTLQDAPVANPVPIISIVSSLHLGQWAVRYCHPVCAGALPPPYVLREPRSTEPAIELS
jgi:hypothetical protein